MPILLKADARRFASPSSSPLASRCAAANNRIPQITLKSSSGGRMCADHASADFIPQNHCNICLMQHVQVRYAAELRSPVLTCHVCNQPCAKPV